MKGFLILRELLWHISRKVIEIKELNYTGTEMDIHLEEFRKKMESLQSSQSTKINSQRMALLYFMKKKHDRCIESG